MLGHADQLLSCSGRLPQVKELVHPKIHEAFRAMRAQPFLQVLTCRSQHLIASQAGTTAFLAFPPGVTWSPAHNVISLVMLSQMKEACQVHPL